MMNNTSNNNDYNPKQNVYTDLHACCNSAIHLRMQEIMNQMYSQFLIFLTLEAPTPQNGQTHSNNSWDWRSKG